MTKQAIDGNLLDKEAAAKRFCQFAILLSGLTGRIRPEWKNKTANGS